MRSKFYPLILAAGLAGAASVWSQEDSFHPPKSHAAAYSLMVAGTVLPVFAAGAMGDGGTAFLLSAGGVLIGPSVGQFYAGSPATGLVGIGLRTLGSFMVVQAFLSCIGSDNCDDGNAGVGAILFFGGVGFSVFETAFAVNRANERARKNLLSGMSLSPMLLPTRDGRRITGLAPGLAMQVGF